MPFPATFKDVDDTDLLANAWALFAPPPPDPSDPAYIAQLVKKTVTEILSQFDFLPYDNPQQIRNFIANNLMLAVTQFKGEGARLKAMEMLGKMKDVGLFEERSLKLIEHYTTEEIKEKLSVTAQRLRERMAQAETVEVKAVEAAK